MTTLHTLENLIAEYRLDAEGWDSVNARLTDFSGHGNHLPIAVAATPTYVTRDGFQHIDFTNTYYFHGDFALPTRFSSVFIGTINAPASEGNLYLWATAKNNSNQENYVDNLSITDADYLSNTYRRKSLLFTSQAARLNDVAGVSATSSTFTAGAINIATAVSASAKLKCAKGTDQPTIGEFTGNTTMSAAAIQGQFFRLGQLKATLGVLSSGNYVSGKRLFLYADDVTEQAGWVAARDAAIVEWGI